MRSAKDAIGLTANPMNLYKNPEVDMDWEEANVPIHEPKAPERLPVTPAYGPESRGFVKKLETTAEMAEFIQKMRLEEAEANERRTKALDANYAEEKPLIVELIKKDWKR